jgi:tripartite-type tricarboxylate transporter receptor subunit TctC
VKERITKLGFTLNVRDPEAFKPYLAKEIQTWAEIIKAAGIKAE